MSRPANPFAPRRAIPERTRQIKAWVRDAYGLNESVVISVTELACRDAGCPEIETVIGIMRPGMKIETIRIHQAVADVARDDLPTASAPASGAG
jgi:hypothetical protein